MIQQVEQEIAGRQLILESGLMAKQAHGAVTVRYGDSLILATVVRAQPREGIDFFPLTVDYREKTSSAGRIPGGYFKREGRPTEKEILTMRQIDRPVRPLFPEGYKEDIQIMISVLSADESNDPDVLGLIGTSAALSISPIPWQGPLGAVRIGRVDGQLVVNPSYDQLEESTLNLVVAGTKEAITMVEGGAKEESEETMLEALQLAQKQIRNVVEMIDDFAGRHEVQKVEFDLPQVDEALVAQIKEKCEAGIGDSLSIADKTERNEAIAKLAEKTIEALTATIEDKDEKASRTREIKNQIKEMEKDAMRRMIVETSRRIDGRGLDEIRPISIQMDSLPRVHGSALFTRGQTQALASTTLGTSSDEQRIDALIGEVKKRFMLHYNFPPFCVGEVRPIRGPGRREIGHGALAERAITPTLPSEEDFPYTLRIVADVLESNGSSSMASVCAGCLSLMDAGVPLTAPVAGIAMGLIKEGDAVRILSDILGVEDHLGDMDFKVAGSRNGITAFQMDLKISGITPEIMGRALEQAKAGRMHILDKMHEAQPEIRPELKSFAPRIETMVISIEKIGSLIGPGGKTIRSIISETGVKLDVEDDGRVMIFSENKEAIDKAKALVEHYTAEAEIGRIYEGKVVRIEPFGAFVNIIPGQDGLVHISRMAEYRVNQVEDIVQMGDIIPVKVIDIDDQGKISLSLKDARRELGQTSDDEIQRGKDEAKNRPPRDDRRGGRSGSGGGRDRDRRGGSDRDRRGGRSGNRGGGSRDRNR